jgi:hypothetical protein
MANLEDYYSGDRAWDEYVAAVAVKWPKCDFKEELLASLNDDLGLAITVYAHLREDALAWIDTRIPALDGETPRACLQSEWRRRRLKEMIMRMPS